MKSKNLHVGVNAWAPPVLIALGIFAVSSLPARQLPPPVIPHLDKAQHGLAYGLLGATCARALALSGATARPALVLGAAGIATLYGASDELHQSLVPGRTPELGDLIADAVGSLTGAALWTRRRRLPGKQRS